MESAASITFKSEYSIFKVLSMRILRYFQTGYLLHLITGLSVWMVFHWSEKLFIAIKSHDGIWQILLFGFLTGHFLSLLFFSQLDARSRFCNYKMIKDKLYEYGFDVRLFRPFMYSRCQRDAIAVAAREMNYTTEWEKLNHEFGFKWYHLLPHLVIKQPEILITTGYWNKTLFVKSYQSKYFLW